MTLWTDKHKPGKVEEMVGQKQAIEETSAFLERWRPGHTLLFHGPPGVGKTLLAEVAAGERNWLLVQLNASESRTGKSLEESLNEPIRQQTLFHQGKLILIDEVDGISGRDRGAVQSLVKIIKESKFPVILSANDPWNPKLRPLRQHCRQVKFGRIPYPSIAKRMREIAEKEGVKVGEETIKNLARWASGDMRSALLDLQLVSIGKSMVTDEDLAALGYREREKGIFDVMPTLFFSKSMNASRKVLRETENDPDDVFWWMEGNLHKTTKNPGRLAGGYDLLAKADLFRSLVHRQQNWRFKAYMIDMMSGVSALREEEKPHFTPFGPPDRLMMMGRTKMTRALQKTLCEKIGQKLHCSSRVVRKDYLPYMKVMLKKDPKILDGFDLTPDEIDVMKSY